MKVAEARSDGGCWPVQVEVGNDRVRALLEADQEVERIALLLGARTPAPAARRLGRVCDRAVAGSASARLWRTAPPAARQRAGRSPTRRATGPARARAGPARRATDRALARFPPSRASAARSRGPAPECAAGSPRATGHPAATAAYKHGTRKRASDAARHFRPRALTKDAVFS